MSRIFDVAIAASPEIRTKGDEALALHLARLRFLRLADLGVVIKGSSSPFSKEPSPTPGQTEEVVIVKSDRTKDPPLSVEGTTGVSAVATKKYERGGKESDQLPVEAGAEWAVAQLELFEICEARTASDALDRLSSGVRFIASAVEACSNRGRPLQAYSAIGADELLPAITWTAIQANPPRLATMLWFVDEYARDDMLRAEAGYAFANVSAAVNFARETLVDAKPLEGLISKADFDKGVKTAHLTQKAVDAAVRRDARQLRLLLAAGADASGCSVDQSTTPLVAAIESRDDDCVAAALAYFASSASMSYPAGAGQSLITQAASAPLGISLSVTDKGSDPSSGIVAAMVPSSAGESKRLTKPVDAPLKRGMRQGMTALMVAASLGETEAVTCLLALGADPDLVDARGRSAGRLARDAGHVACAEALECGPPIDPDHPDANPLVYRALSDVAACRGLLLRGADVNKPCGLLGCTPLVAAAAAGDIDTISVLLRHPGIDVDACAKSGAFAGQTALMRCVGLDLNSAEQHNETRRSLAKQGKLKLPKALFAANAAAVGAGPGIAAGLKAAITGLFSSHGPAMATTPAAQQSATEEGFYSVKGLDDVFGPEDAKKTYMVARSNLPAEDPTQPPAGLRGFVRGAEADYQVAIATKLVAMGASRTRVDANGRSAIKWAEVSGGHPRLLAVLRNDPAREKIFEKARDRKSQDVVALLEQGVDPDATCPEKHYTPLVAAAYNDDIELARLLITPPPKTVFFEVDDEDEAYDFRTVQLPLQQLKQPQQEKNKPEALRSWFPGGRRRQQPQEFSYSATAKGFDASSPKAASGMTSKKEMALSLAAAKKRRRRLAKRWRPADVNRRSRNGLTPLMYAAQRKSHALVTLLLRMGANREAQDDRGRRALDHAENTQRAPDGSDASTREQLRELLSVDPRKMLLVEAAARDDAAKCAALIAQGASPNECRRVHSANGWHLELFTPLIAAAAYDAHRAATALIDTPGTRLDLANSLGLSPLHYAAFRGSSTLILALLRAGGDRHRRDRRGRTPLDWARRRAAADAETLRRASRQSASVDGDATMDRADRLAVPLLLYDPKRHTTMQCAAKGAVDGVVALVKQGVDVNAVDRSQQNETALLAACAHRQFDVLLKLLTHPAIDVNLANSRGVSALMQAAAAGFDQGVLKLLKASADRYAQTPQGRVAADYAEEHGHIALAALLRADPDIVSIHEVAESGDFLSVEGLLRQQPELLNQRRREDGAPPILVAAAEKRIKVVDHLLRQPDVQVDRTNSRKETALMHACGAGALDIASRLLAKGASSRARDADGKNPTSWATKRESALVLFDCNSEFDSAPSTSAGSYSNMLLYLALLSVS